MIVSPDERGPGHDDASRTEGGAVVTGAVVAARHEGRIESNQILKKYSGMATRYFRLMVHRSTILIGRLAMNRSRTASTENRRNPPCSMIFLKNEIRDRIAGTSVKYARQTAIPGASRTRMFVGR